MDALLLCAGRGTRLEPFTNSIPKALMPVRGRPLIEYWLVLLKLAGFKRIFINVHHLADQIIEMVSAIKDDDLEIRILKENTLRGTGGTICENIKFFNSHLLVIYGDNYGLTALDPLIISHKKIHEMNINKFTLLTFTTFYPKNCGIFEINDECEIVSFQEKPSFPKSNIASGAIYLFNRCHLEEICEINATDISAEYLTHYYQQANLWHFDGPYMDIGNIQNLRTANTIHFNMQANLLKRSWLKNYYKRCENTFVNEPKILRHIKKMRSQFDDE